MVWEGEREMQCLPSTSVVGHTSVKVKPDGIHL